MQRERNKHNQIGEQRRAKGEKKKKCWKENIQWKEAYSDRSTQCQWVQHKEQSWIIVNGEHWVFVAVSIINKISLHRYEHVTDMKPNCIQCMKNSENNMENGHSQHKYKIYSKWCKRNRAEQNRTESSTANKKKQKWGNRMYKIVSFRSPILAMRTTWTTHIEYNFQIIELL